MRRVLAILWPSLLVERRVEAPTSFDAVLDALDELSPRVEARSRGVALLDVTGLERLVGDDLRVARRAVALIRRVDGAAVPLRLGIADNRWLAVVAARRAERAIASDARYESVPAGAGRGWLADLPISILPASEAARSRFVLFGLTRVGQLAELARSAVGAQFGEEGERLHALARGEDPRPIVPRRRPERVVADLPFDPAIEPGAVAFAVRRTAAELCEQLAMRHRAPARATLELRLEDAPPFGVEVILPQPALEPEWIARLVVSRLEASIRRRAAVPGGEVAEHRVAGLRLTLDRLSDPWSRQLPAFEPQAGRWEELRWSLERMRSRFGPGRLRRAVHDRPYATLAERQARLVDIGLEADAT